VCTRGVFRCFLKKIAITYQKKKLHNKIKN